MQSHIECGSYFKQIIEFIPSPKTYIYMHIDVIYDRARLLCGYIEMGFVMEWDLYSWSIGRIRLSVSTVNRTYELSGITHVTPFRKKGKHSTGPSTYGLWVRTYSKLFSCKPALTVCRYGTQSNEICTYGRVSRGTLPRVRMYALLYLRTVEYDHSRPRTWP